jgi:hypothetical protein
MQSRARIITIIVVSLAVPTLTIWQRWSEIRVFARELTNALTQSADSRPGKGGGSFVPGNRPDGTTPAALAAAGNWEKAIDQVLTQKAEPAVIGTALLELLPSLPEAGRTEAVQHMANLLPNEGYEPASRMLANPETSSEVQDVLLTDLLNRPNALKLPVLLEVARTPEHAKAQQAKDLLQPYLVDDYSTDWAKAQEKVAIWLKEHPDT